MGRNPTQLDRDFFSHAIRIRSLHELYQYNGMAFRVFERRSSGCSFMFFFLMFCGLKGMVFFYANMCRDYLFLGGGLSKKFSRFSSQNLGKPKPLVICCVEGIILPSYIQGL